MFKVTVNTDQEREIELSGNDFTINGRQGTWDKISIGNHRFHIVKDNRSYTCEVLQFVKEKKTFSIRVNGTVYQVQVKDRFDALLKQLGMEEAAVHKINAIKAPMPGLVLKVIVTEGQEINAGDSVLILEAMKMENVIKSPGTGIVKNIKVKAKDAVEKNQVLIELK
ncbi:MAG: acetyl-CoA carboxylase biotin carboxyl carrier protein subunit [Chitinophagaceae bacterium]|nr:acetyl-CoA carboxylase biotin carboxyl carrier protein subunit [Chitinophagaceae bacterium]